MYVCDSFPFCSEGGMWDLIVFVPFFLLMVVRMFCLD